MRQLTEEFHDLILENKGKKFANISEATLDELPIFNKILPLYNIGKEISEYRFNKKILLFIDEMNLGKASKDTIKNMNSKFENNPKFKSKVLETLLLTIDRLDNEWKSKILARLFSQFINDQYTWNEFQDLSRINSLLFFADINLIAYLIDNDQPITIKDINIDSTKAPIERLKTYGFLEFVDATWDSLDHYESKKIKLTSEGIDFYNNCLYNLNTESDIQS